MTVDADQLARLDALAELLPLLSEALDIRDVFGHVSRITHRVLPHDSLALALLSEDRQSLSVHAISGDVDFARPDRMAVPPELRALLDEPWDALLCDDMRDDPIMRQMPPVRAGLRSSLRVPMRRDARLIGGLNFMSRDVARFTGRDVPIARRVAAYAALTLAHQELAQAAARAAEARERAAALEERVRSLNDELAVFGRGTPRRIVGTSAAWRQAVGEAAQVAATDTTVLLTGESGTGKEVLARFIHGASPRAQGPFVAVNCAALPEALLESELFGHERGAFTGASHARPGLIEQAAGGILLLDEVGELSPGAQAKLLRVLQEREFQRLGSGRTRRADVRVICRHAPAPAPDGGGRTVPRGPFLPSAHLRHRPAAAARTSRGRAPPRRGPARRHRQTARTARTRPGTRRAAAAAGYDWPGNIRELRNVLERAAILAGAAPIGAAHLALPGLSRASGAAPRAVAAGDDAGLLAAGSTLPDVERQLVADALRLARYNKSRAARSLGLTRAQLYVRLRRHGLDA